MAKKKTKKASKKATKKAVKKASKKIIKKTVNRPAPLPAKIKRIRERGKKERFKEDVRSIDDLLEDERRKEKQELGYGPQVQEGFEEGMINELGTEEEEEEEEEAVDYETPKYGFEEEQ